MGFWEYLAGTMATAVISEKKKVNQERQSAEQKRLSDEINALEQERDFLDYMVSINCVNVMDFDEAISAKSRPGDVWQTKRVIEYYKEKIKEYMRLGGNPFYITNFANMDLYIEIVRRLKEYGWLDKQEKYVYFAEDTFFLDIDWEQEQKERHKNNVQISAFLNAQGNQLSEVVKRSDQRFIPYDSHTNAIAIDTAKSNDETISNFLDFLTISIIFTDQYIIVYNYEHDEMYYKADIATEIVDIFTGPVSNDWSLVEVNGLSLLFNTEKALKVSQLYDLHNANLFGKKYT